jgi:WD40 repeat protein
LKLWDVASGAVLQTFEGHTQSVNAVVAEPDGRGAISASHDGTLKLWDLASGAVVAAFAGEAPYTAVAIARDPLRVIAGDERGRFQILRIENVNWQDS